MNERLYLAIANFWRGVCIGSIIGLGVATFVTDSAGLVLFLRIALPVLGFLTLIPSIFRQFIAGLIRYRTTRAGFAARERSGHKLT